MRVEDSESCVGLFDVKRWDLASTRSFQPKVFTSWKGSWIIWGLEQQSTNQLAHFAFVGDELIVNEQ